MAKPQYVIVGDSAVEMAQETRKWANSHGTYIAGRAYVDEADLTAAEMETKWGADRLRLLVGPELRTKFDRQRYLFNQAIWHGELEDVRRESGRMINAWLALDAAATAAGKTKLSSAVWEITLTNGTVAALVQDATAARQVVADGRRVNVYTLEEIARLLDGFPEIAKVHAAFPGATVTAVRRSIEDPLDAIDSSKPLLDDVIPW